MGHYTYYALKVSALDDEAEDFWAVEDAVWNYLYELANQDSEMYYALVSRAPSCDWPQYNEDMLLLSAKFPDVRLSLVRQEENNSWRKIYENGKRILDAKERMT